MADDKVYWLSPVGEHDDFGNPIENIIIDGRTCYGGGQWALMSPSSWAVHGGTGGRLGLGLGQKFERQIDGRWLKTEG